MTPPFLAKSRPVETIQEHTGYLLRNFELLKKVYPSLPVDWEILRLALIFHDLGKMNHKFQNKLNLMLRTPLLPDLFPQEEEIPHGNLSAAFLDRKKLKETFDDQTLSILYQAVYYHHPRHMGEERVPFYKQLLEQELQAHLSEIPPGIPYAVSVLKHDFNKYIRDRIDCKPGYEALFNRYVMVKGLLNRLDYAASAHIDVETPNLNLQEKTLAFLNAKGGLRPIQQYLKDHQDENLVIVASTGIGKTEGGLLWLGNNKGFFTLPLRVSINAIYDRIKNRDIHFEDTALHHSDALAFMIQKDESMTVLEDHTRARQLSMPLTVTTVDQLFKIVFKADGFESVLATLAYSRVIIDEIQMYSPEIVACIIMGLKYITAVGGKFAILTATFPGVLEHFMQSVQLQYGSAEFILSPVRHKVKLRHSSIMEACSEIILRAQTSKVLVIVNTVKRAQMVFEALGDQVNKHLLHSRFIKADRRLLEQQIKDFSDSEQYGVWVSTQIVEASLDIDFDYLFTEMSTIDGLLQRMGRCYRKREIPSGIFEPNIHIFLEEVSGIGKIIDTEIFDLSVAAIASYDGRVMLETEKLDAVKEVYSLEKIKGTQYYKAIRDRLHTLEILPAYELNRNDVEEKFRNIKSFNVIPIGVYQGRYREIEGWISEIRQLGFARDAAERNREKIRKIELIAKINDLTLDVPFYYKKGIKAKQVIDKFNSFQIIELGYDGKIGLKG